MVEELIGSGSLNQTTKGTREWHGEIGESGTDVREGQRVWESRESISERRLGRILWINIVRRLVMPHGRWFQVGVH